MGDWWLSGWGSGGYGNYAGSFGCQLSSLPLVKDIFEVICSELSTLRLKWFSLASIP